MNRRLILVLGAMLTGLYGCGQSNGPSVSTTATQAPASASAPARSRAPTACRVGVVDMAAMRRCGLIMACRFMLC